MGCPLLHVTLPTALQNFLTNSKVISNVERNKVNVNGVNNGKFKMIVQNRN